MDLPYRFAPASWSDGEIARTSALLRRVYPQAPYLTPRYLAWQYRDNPDGRAIGIQSWAGETLVGHVAAQPLVARIEGQRATGVFLLNAAVHPDHTRRSIMRTITQAIVEAAEAAGFDFAIGMGNRFSTRLFLRPFDRTPAFTLVAPLEARIGVGAPARGQGDISGFARQWSVAALAWRAANPERPYRVTRRGEGVRVLAPTGKTGIGALLYEGADDRVLAPRGEGRTGPLTLWLGLDPAIRWGRSPFLPIPHALRPSPLNLVYKPFGDSPARLDPARVLFRAWDFDPY